MGTILTMADQMALVSVSSVQLHTMDQFVQSGQTMQIPEQGRPALLLVGATALVDEL